MHCPFCCGAGIVVVVEVGGTLGVVVVAGTVVDGVVTFGFAFAVGDPHPRAAIPATKITATAASRFAMGMYPPKP
jgi:hypothetical protein